MAEANSGRDRVLTALAVSMGVMAFSNFMKPVAQLLSPESSAGFVFFGERLHGFANLVVATAFGLLLGKYAYAVWTLSSFALPLALLYAIYVPLNLILFALNPPPDAGGLLFGIVYATVAMSVSVGGAGYIWAHRDRFA